MAKKVLLISYNYFPELTGIGKYNTELCEHLNDTGYEVKVITGYPYYPNWKLFAGYFNNAHRKEIINGVKVIRCPLYIPVLPTGSTRMIQDLSFYLSSLMVVIYQILTFKTYDIIITPSPSFLNGFHGLLLKLFCRKSIFVFHVQDLQVDAALELGIIKNKWIKNLLLGLEKIIMSGATVVSTISEGMREKILSKKYKLSEVTLFPNWVDNKKVFRQKVDHSIIEALGIDLQKKIFFYSGAIGEKQGLEVILDMAPGLTIEAPDLLFVISGSGPYKNKLELQAFELGLANILFIDLQPVEIFNQLLNYAHCHLIIQKRQNGGDLFLPSKLSNILAVGGLCVVTASPGSSLYNVILENQIGILVPPENSEELERKIIEIHYQL